jgi:aminoglycoside phosphotransferase (APT) family kinase protein
MLSGEDRQIKIRLLSAMRREIEAVVMPELSSAYGKLAASWVCQTIDYLLLGESGSEQLVAARDAVLATMPKAAGGAAGYLPDIRDPHRAIDAIAASVRATGQAMKTDTIGAIGSIAHEAILDEDRFVAERRTRALQRMNDIEIEATPARFDRFFDSTQEFCGYRTEKIVRMVGGYSRDTFLIAVRTPAGAVTDFAVRRDLPFGPVEASAADEFGFLERLREFGIPVARPRAAVYERAFIGQPFLLTDRVPGVVASEPMSADRAIGESGAREMARMLARLHGIDPRDVNLKVSSDDPRTQIAAAVDYWRNRWLRYRCHESDVMEASFAWLDANIPRKVPRSVIVHGDYRPENAMMDQGKISAMLDWEFIHAGDAAEDVEYMKLFVQPFLDAAEFTKEYLAAGGVEFDSASSNFYEVFRSVRNVVCTDTSWYGFLTGAYPSMRLSWQGTTARRLLLKYLAEALQKVTGSRD